ncbi:MAG: TRAP transporter small permease subunit [Rhodospirillaceae bacterium]|nr:TRAP transporter small permease subunit [Rhodospirillaceae bacterium]MYF85110.1 TRAP transporter small permease subunit [Rhodospirillaceae bacterium]MYH36631.1 TRAP transporter small permease subunit [Rhodospirillaceae bacterium]MYK13463.1 TRAP transporter small permease subunit [Rhodospirillaceae bacterium]MYK57461.1 TRAP transporter small permease subunit [Rhodospirillaceae bacterium]
MSTAATAGSGTLSDLTAAAAASGRMQPALRILALSVSYLGFVYLANAYLVFWLEWPGVAALLGDAGLLGFVAPKEPLGGSVTLAFLQIALYPLTVVAIVVYVLRTRQRTLYSDAQRLSAIGAFIARAAFWSVLLVGLADAVVSFLRVEGLLVDVVGKSLAQDLGKSAFRAQVMHLPLMAVAIAISLFTRSVGFTWLALLVVVAELQIVILRFLYSYEQAFMADLVRFWYAALFLFASAYTLLHEGHVRVDVLYSGFGARRRAWVNAVGAAILGAPVCWIVMTMGLANKFSVVSGPLLSFEVTQAGFGLYVKYMLAGYLLVFAVTMLLEFMASLLSNAGVLLEEADAPKSTGESDVHH